MDRKKGSENVPPENHLQACERDNVYGKLVNRMWSIAEERAFFVLIASHLDKQDKKHMIEMLLAQICEEAQSALELAFLLSEGTKVMLPNRTREGFIPVSVISPKSVILPSVALLFSLWGDIHISKSGY